MPDLENKKKIRGCFRLIRGNPCERIAVRSLVGLMLLSASLNAQVKPNSDWRTIRTPRFYIHYTPELESVARRAAVQAESAYVALARHLHPPRGPIDIVISDDVDLANGSATPYPTNRISVYANPPIFEGSLRFTDDPIDLVVTHELAHVFHLDRVGGYWALLQRVLGRYPLFFPNLLHPRWVTEGLAVYYESLLTGSGRLFGSEHDMIARSAAVGHALPRIDQLSLVNPHFPYGYSAYAYGSLMMNYLGQAHGDSAMRAFVDASSRRLIPWSLDAPARRAFGRSFTAAYRAWTDSLVKHAPPDVPPIRGWRDLTVDGVFAHNPRWLDDSTVVYAGTDGRESFGAYAVRIASGQRERLARRHSRSPNTRLSDGSLVYSQSEYTSPYTLRSDLYMDRARGGTVRLTHSQRLSLPDARGDGSIVAVQTIPAGTRLALVSQLGRVITPITSGGPDEHWSEPSWSPDGVWIAAARWTRGGTTEIVVVDTAGRVVQTLVRERATASTPSWSPDGRYVYFASDRSGIPNLYRARVSPDGGAASLEQLSDASTGLFEPRLSPSGRHLAAIVFRADGYHVGVTPLDSLDPRPAPPEPRAESREPKAVGSHDGASTKYSPWRLLVPRYFLPIAEAGLEESSARFGVFVSGQDIVERHAYDASLAVPTDNSGLTGAIAYRNASFGWPIDVSYSQDWENRGLIVDQSEQGEVIGTLRRRIRDAAVSISYLRPRVRTSSYVSLGAGYEARDYAAAPSSALGRIDSLYGRTYYYPRITTSFGWSNAQLPLFAVSPEDGVSLAVTARQRWRSSPRPLPDSALSPADPAATTRTTTVSVVSSLAAYKSLDLPGFSHHVIALRGAAGLQDNRGTGYFEVGGSSGGVVDVVPGYVLGEGRRTFSVRGFDAATLVGMRALQGSAEYRAPLRLPGRGLGTLPLFLDRTNVTLFGDVGAAWCPDVFPARPAPATSLCTAPDVAAGVLTKPDVIASVGGELSLVAAVLTWDVPYRWRFGFAAPLVAPAGYTLPNPRFYFAVGSSF
jgi:hypothetical protein